MNSKRINFNEIRKDFSFLKENDDILGVLLFGSHANGKPNIKSDIDVCIVVPKLKSPSGFSEFLRYIWRNVDGAKYDIRIFEELPLYIKINVIKNNKVILSKSIRDLQDYFYEIRKIWDDQSVNWLEKKNLMC